MLGNKNKLEASVLSEISATSLVGFTELSYCPDAGSPFNDFTISVCLAESTFIVCSTFAPSGVSYHLTNISA